MTVVKALGNFPIRADNRPLRPEFQNIIHSHNSTWETLALVGEKTPVCYWVVVDFPPPPPPSSFKSPVYVLSVYRLFLSLGWKHLPRAAHQHCQVLLGGYGVGPGTLGLPAAGQYCAISLVGPARGQS